MSARAKTRKNAGEGYGYMFHGAFKDKKDAVAKERKTKGAWVKGVFTKQGHRYVVMSPRTNPIKRKPKRELFVEGKKFRRWESAFKYAQKLAKKVSNRIEVLVREDGHELRHYVDPPERRGNLIDAHGHYTPDTPNKTESYKGYEIQVFGRGRVLVPGSGRTFRSVAKAKHAIDTWEAARARGQNPHELLIMGANPHSTERDFTVPPGSTITIRMNPTEVNPDRYTSIHAQTSGRSYQAPGLIQTERQRRVAGMVRTTRRTASKHKYDWIPSEGIAPGQNPGDDPYMYQAVAQLYPGKTLGQLSMSELSQVAQLAARLKHPSGPRRNRRQNPSAERIREEFTGASVEHEHVRHEPHMPAGDYAQLGKLLSLYVKPRTGGQVLEIRPTNVIVVSDESAQQLWFVGGDQDVTDALAQFGALERGPNLYELGEARRIDYEQRKEHVPDPDQDHWRHSFGEETDVRPKVLFDRAHKRLMLEGGQYEIRREGIVN
jgi:hypothetical protein